MRIVWLALRVVSYCGLRMVHLSGETIEWVKKAKEA